MLARLLLIAAVCAALPGCLGTPAAPAAGRPTSPAPASPAATAPPDGPAAAQWHGMVYHERLGVALLVNGRPERERPSERPLELWGWDGGAWTLLAADGPPWRNGAAIAYDTHRAVLVIHGGWQGEGRGFDETWEWDGRTWTRHSAPGPGFRLSATMVYDPARRQAVLAGGLGDDGLRGDTWAWDGRAWTLLAASGPSPRFPGALGYDPATERLVLYGGHFALPSGEFENFGDTWAWDGEAWQELSTPAPGTRLTTALLSDKGQGRLLLIGGAADGAYVGDIWAWDGATWQLVAEDGPPRGFHSVAYDAARGRVVLFGGFDRQGGRPLNDTWEWDGASWRCAAGCP